MADMITAGMIRAAGQIATTIFHPVVTARMGPAIGTPLKLVGKTQIFPNY